MPQIYNKFIAPTFRPEVFEETSDGFLRVKARVLQAGIMPYHRSEIAGIPDEVEGEMINLFVPPDEITAPESLRTLEGAQIAAPDHQWIEPTNYTDSKGNTAGSPRINGDFAEIDLLITDPETIQAIRDRQIGEISGAYHADAVFEPGEYNGTPYQAKQVGLRWNHIAIIPFGHGRGGQEVRILNHKPPIQEGANVMSDAKMVRVQLANGRFVNTDEEGAAVLAAQGEESTKSLESVMNELEGKNSELASCQAACEELKGELSVYKEKLDELLEGGVVEAAAAEQVAEAGDAEEIVENTFPEGEEKEKVMNSLKGLYGHTLRSTVLAACGVKVENMDQHAVKGAFKAQAQICNTMKGRRPVTVAGAKVLNHGKDAAVVPVQRTARQRLGLTDK